MALTATQQQWQKMLWGLILGCSIVIADGLQLTDSVIEWVGKKYGQQARSRAENWRNLLNSQISTEQAKLEKVNDFFNQIPYRDDFEHWDKVVH